MALSSDNRQLLRGLIARIDLDEYADRVNRGVAGMPEYREFVEGRPGRRDRGLPGIRANLEIFLSWVPRGGLLPEPEDMERLRAMIGARAAEGHPPEQGLAVYRRAVRAGWEALLEVADENERAALGGAFEIPLDWLDVVARVFDQVYAEERDALIGQDERRARWLFERLVGAGEPGADDRRLAEALGFELAAAYRPFAVALPGAPTLRHLQLARDLRERGVLAIAEGGGVAGLAHAAVGWSTLSGAEQTVVCEAEAVDRGLLGEALVDLRRVVALASARGQRGMVGLDERIPELLLARSPWLATRLRGRVFGPLEAAGREDLAATLAVLAEHGFERAPTASAVPVHRNTLTRRIDRIEELTGLRLGDSGDRGLIWLATRGQPAPEPLQG